MTASAAAPQPAGHHARPVKLVTDAIEDAPWPCEHSNPASTDPGDWWTCSACQAAAAIAALAGAIRAEAKRLEEEDGQGYSYAYGFADAATFLIGSPEAKTITTGETEMTDGTGRAVDEPHITIDDTVDITFRKAVVTGVYSDGSIEVQTAGPCFRVHPNDIDTEVKKLWSVKP